MGDCALLRGLGRGRIWWALPVRVVQDTPDLTALYWCAGSCGKATQKRPVVEDVVAGGDLPLVDWVWKDTNVLSLAIPGEAFSVYAMWVAETNELCCWYINLQHPLLRGASGFDTCDYLLDMVISPDRSEWHWKDEDEMQRSVMLGVFSKEKAQAIREEGERALQKTPLDIQYKKC